MSYESDLAQHYDDIHAKFFPAQKPTNLAFEVGNIKNELGAISNILDIMRNRLSGLEKFKIDLERVTVRIAEVESLIEPFPRNPQQQFITIERIIQLVGAGEGVPRKYILSHHRTMKYCNARHMIAFLATCTARFSYPQIGQKMLRDHTTILHSDHLMKEQRKKNPEIKAKQDAYWLQLTGKKLVVKDVDCELAISSEAV